MDKLKRILQVVHGFPPVCQTGVELYCYYLSKLLSKKYKISIFCREGDPSKKEFSTQTTFYDSIEVFKVFNNFSSVRKHSQFYNNKIIDEIFLKHIKSQRPDLIHFQHCAGLSASLIEITKKLGIPCVLELHDFWFICEKIQKIKPDFKICESLLNPQECFWCMQNKNKDFPSSVFGLNIFNYLKNRSSLIIKGYLPFTLKKVIKKALPNIGLSEGGPAYEDIIMRQKYLSNILTLPDIIIVHSKFLKCCFLKYGLDETKIEIIPIGVFLNSPSFERKRLPADGIKFGYMGAVLGHKGIHILLKAFKMLNGNKASLDIFGCSPNLGYLSEIRRLLKQPNVNFHGRYENKDIYKIFSKIDVLVVPSLWPETFSIVTHEAFSHKIPVIASRIGALPEAVKDGENGFLVKPNDINDLKSKMQIFIETPGILEKLREKIRESVTINESFIHTESIYEQLLSNYR